MRLLGRSIMGIEPKRSGTIEERRLYLKLQARKFRKLHPGATTIYGRRHRAKKFGVNYPTWWLCDLCDRPISFWDGEICLDHNHTTGKFRGWLCQSCNLGLGYIELLSRMRVFQYLNRSPNRCWG